MKRDMPLARIVNREFGTLKYIPKEYVTHFPEELKSYKYVRDNNFTDEELQWHVDQIIDALTKPRAVYKSLAIR